MNALNITIPVGRFLTYQIRTVPDKECIIEISADFPLFQNGNDKIMGKITNEGKVDIFTY
jgi:hypothetical protein